MSARTSQLSPVELSELPDDIAPTVPLSRNTGVGGLHHRIMDDTMDCDFPEAAMMAALDSTAPDRISSVTHKVERI
jgi:hypothetical protein